jgi:hypothetical protein
VQTLAGVCQFGMPVSSLYKTIAATSAAPRAIQHIALRCSPANQYPVAALKQRTELVHPLVNAAGLLSSCSILIASPSTERSQLLGQSEVKWDAPAAQDPQLCFACETLIEIRQMRNGPTLAPYKFV